VAQRFAPFMVQNTFSIPMDFKKLMRRTPTFNLHIDTWDVAHGQQLVGRETIDLNSLGEARCPSDGASALPFDPASADCRLLQTLAEFDPEGPPDGIARTTAVDVRTDRFKVLYFDLPGHDPETWKATYVNPVTDQLLAEYQNAIKVYAHPFIHEIYDTQGQVQGYEFVIQYWFYYPLNDGGNNHEGDWEHIDVLIAPRARVDRFLRDEDVRAILAGQGLTDQATDQQLVIRRVEYYFHHKVMTMDYTRPNVYLPYNAWDQEVEALTHEQIGVTKLWEWIRRNAYRDSSGTSVNTHPIAYIGADNKGLDQLISPPGGRNQDSHGTFPFPGLYKTVGPAGSAEQIREHFDHWKWFANLPASRAKNSLGLGAGHVVLFDESSLLKLVPDWERVLPLVRSDPDARRDWAWLVLPVRWGYPASASPLAGLVANADMGNVGPVGPAFNDGWNRTGTARGFEQYEPHVLPSLFPVEPQDGFSNSLGYFNLIPAIANLPPLDLIWRVVALPFRATLKRQDPIYYPEQAVPFRFVGITGGPTYTTTPEDTWFAVAHLTDNNAVDFDGAKLPSGLVEIAAGILARDSLEGADIPHQSMSEGGWGVQAQVAFYIGRHFVSSTGFRHATYVTGFDQPLTTGGTYQFRSDVNWWDLTGNIRYDLFTGGFKPYITLGYGVNWYRLENMTSDGEPFQEPTGDWINNFWPPTWLYGGGAELMLVQSVSPIPRGIDLGIKAEWMWLSGPTGINLPGVLSLQTFREVPSRWVRGALNLSLTVSF
jgi:hypothetical protein